MSIRHPSNGLCAVLVAYFAAACAVQAAPATVEFSIGDRTLFAEHTMLGHKRAPVVLALEPVHNAAAVATLKRSGAQIIGRRDEVGYIYALVPLAAVGSVLEIPGLQSVQLAANPVRADLGEKSTAPDHKPGRHPRGAAPTPALPADNPYSAEGATQALAFKAQHPTFDGRGVVTAFVEPVAPNLNTLRDARDLRGRSVAKFVGYDLGKPVNAAEAVATNLETWQRTEAVTPDAQGAFTWREASYRLPSNLSDAQIAKTQWRMCRRTASEWNKIKDNYDVLWAVELDRVWVLPTTEAGDFSKAGSTSLLDPAPFVTVGDPKKWVEDENAIHAYVFNADRQQKWLGFVGAWSSHAGMVGSVMMGSRFMGSQASGVAPGAQVMIFVGGQTTDAPSHDGYESMLSMLANPSIDLAQSSRAVGDTGRFGAVAPHKFWVDRFIRMTGRPYVRAAGNFGATLFGSDEFNTGGEAFSVGGYTPKQTWKVNFGIDPPAEHVLASYSGWGPTKDGALKPDFLSLTHTLSEGHGMRWYWEDTPGFEDYAVSGGTSAAAPHGAGNVALLISAGKQTGVPHDASRLRAAIATTAKFLEGVEARAQGHGLIQVNDAWTALQRAKNWRPAAFTMQAPLVGAETKPTGAQKFIGRGLFELSGWKPGQQGRREVIVTRTAGTKQPGRYQLRWKGHTQAFTSALASVELPLNKPVAIPVDIKVSESGSYSAILDLIDPGVNLVAGSVLCTVMVSDPLPVDGTVLTYRQQTIRPGNMLVYVDVPAGLSVLSVKFTKDAGKSFLVAQDPTGRDLPLVPYGSEVYKFDADALALQERVFNYADPVPGVWQFNVRNAEPRSMEDLNLVEDWSKPVPIELQIRGLAAKSSALPAAPSEVSFHNQAGAFEATVQAVGLGAARNGELTLQPGLKPQFFEVQVDPGATRLEVEMQHAAAEAQVGLYVYKVPEGKRVETTLVRDDTALVYYEPSFKPRKTFALTSPPPGRYQIALDPVRIPAGGLKVAYRETTFHPLYGAVELADKVSLLEAGQSRAAEVEVKVRAKPTDGRKLVAEVGLFMTGDEEKKAPVATQLWAVEP